MRTHSPLVWSLAFAALLLLGCPQPVVLVDGGLQLDPNGDEDGDGLKNGAEVAGYVIQVNLSGAPDEVTEVSVTSDPTLADTDGDQLDDAAELRARTDPNSPDTDSDGLSDFDEVRRWQTSPTSVDTDGDATGSDHTSDPLPVLFDGSELKLVNSTTPGVGATSPTLADTDGDGKGDYDELIDGRREPTLAESPQVSLTLSPRTSVDVYLNVTYADSMGQASSYGSSISSTSATTHAASASVWASAKLAIETSLSEDVKASVGCCGTIGGSVEASVTLGAEVTATVGAGVSTGYDYNTESGFTTEATRATTQSLGRTVTTSSGSIRAAFVLANTSRIAFTVESPTVVVSRSHAGAPYEPIGTLSPEQTATTRWTLAPGETATIIMSNTSLPADTVKAFLANPSALVFAPGPLNLLSAGEANFAFVEANVQANTAQFVFRPLTGAAKVARIATNVAHDATGALSGVPLRNVLKKVEVPFTERFFDGGVAVTIAGRGPVLHPGTAPSLNDPPYGQTSGPGVRVLKEQWYPIVIRASTLPRPDVDNVLDARLFRGDTFVLAYVSDADRDGLNSAQEEALGSSDSTVDSDQGVLPDGGLATDGMSDFWEAREGWLVRTTLDGALTDERRVYSSPRSLDSDGDGLTDDVERALGSDPRTNDTDRDGFVDGLEVNGAPDGGAGTDGGILGVDRTPPVLIVAQQTVAPNATNAGDDDFTMRVQVADLAGDVVSMRFDWSDGSTDDCSSDGSTACLLPRTSKFFSNVTLTHTFIVDTPRTVTVQAIDKFGDVTTVTSTFVPRSVAGAWYLSLPTDPMAIPGTACVGDPGAAGITLHDVHLELNIAADLSGIAPRRLDLLYLGPDTQAYPTFAGVGFLDTRRNLAVFSRNVLWQYYPTTGNAGLVDPASRFAAVQDEEVRCHFEAMGQTATTPVCELHAKLSYWGLCTGKGYYDVTVPLIVTR